MYSEQRERHVAVKSLAIGDVLETNVMDDAVSRLLLPGLARTGANN